MECSVHSPCGRYLVRFCSGPESLCIDVAPKVSAFQPSPSVRYVAVLRESDVADITTAAGVRKDFRGFADMSYNAMLGRSPCVKFFIETCEEMRSRITADAAARGVTDASDSDSSRLSDTSRAQRFFTLDYDVDFTRAVFPVPLVEATGGEADAWRRGAAPPDSAPDAEVSRLRAENERLRRENAALTRLSREKMLEMQRLCEDFERRVDGAAELERMAKKLTALRAKLRVAEAERDAARAAQHGPPRREGPRPPSKGSARLESPSAARRSTGRRRSRFDTPPRRFGDSPAPNGRTGGRPAPRSRSSSAAGAAVGAQAGKRRGRFASPSPVASSRCSSAASRCSSRGSFERLYRTPTASSRMHRRESSPLHSQHRAVFR